ncbi:MULTISPECIES: N-acetyltransferase [Streptomyces]|uniref:N-acetyltransferase n=1 Tax=Streptomyces TaxID=1883 RepID=UPI00345BFFEE
MLEQVDRPHNGLVEALRQTILDLHAEVRGDFGLMSKPFNGIERFGERLTAYAQRPGWQAVVTHTTSHEPVGFCLSTPLAPNTAWWASMLDPLHDSYTTETGHRTMTFQEICICMAWRGRGWPAARTTNSSAAAPRKRHTPGRPAPQAGDGTVQAVYKSW